MNNKEKYIPLILRISVAFLWIWMAIVPKLMYPAPRVAMLGKSWLASFSPVSLEYFIFILAIVELILGIMLLFGIYTKITSALQIGLMVLFIVGLINIAAMQGITSPLTNLLLKDIPLFAISIVLMITGGGAYSYDNWRKNMSSNNILE